MKTLNERNPIITFTTLIVLSKSRLKCTKKQHPPLLDVSNNGGAVQTHLFFSADL
jgi:hypothetical protein